MKPRNLVILTVVALGTIGFAVAAFLVNDEVSSPSQNLVEEDMAEFLVRPYSPILGPEDAPVTIVEFFDPACEACRAFHPIVKDILAQHPDQVRVVIRYTPFHGAASEQAVLLLEAARMQGLFEPVLEAILLDQGRWASHGSPDVAALFEIAGATGLDIELAESQIRAPQSVATLNQDKNDVQAVGVRGTPTFFVNGRRVEPFGEATLRSFVSAAINEENL